MRDLDKRDGMVRGQLWWLLVTHSEDTEFWSQKRSDERELEEARPRQLGETWAMRGSQNG